MSAGVAVLLPFNYNPEYPALGFTAISQIIRKAYPSVHIQPVYLDDPRPPERVSVLVANLYSAWAFKDVMRLFRRWGWDARDQRSCVVCIGGTGALNPLPIQGLVDYVCKTEEGLIQVLSTVTGLAPRPWTHPELIWASTPYITYIMPTTGCRYRCSFCQLIVLHQFKFETSPIETIADVIALNRPKRIQVHSASILQHPDFLELTTILRSSGSEIYFGSMNLNEVNRANGEALLSCKPRHTIGVEDPTNDSQAYFGLESGSRRLLREVHKPLTVSMALSRVRVLRECGFTRVGFYLIHGYPGTGAIDYRDTARLLTQFSELLGDDVTIRSKGTPFLPHLGTQDSQKPARPWAECLNEHEYIRSATSPSVHYTISEPSYYLANLILMRGQRRHDQLVSWLAEDDGNVLESDEMADQILHDLGLPSLQRHLSQPAPLDLSLAADAYISAHDLGRATP